MTRREAMTRRMEKREAKRREAVEASPQVADLAEWYRSLSPEKQQLVFRFSSSDRVLFARAKYRTAYELIGLADKMRAIGNTLGTQVFLDCLEAKGAAG